MNRKTALYIRVSTADQTTDSQEHELRRQCELRGWADPVLYRESVSGAKITRPELDRLLKDVRAGRIDRVVCYKLDRLGRSLPHLAIILDELARLHVPLVCTSQGIDTSDNNPVGKLQLGVLMAVAEFEREIIRERTKAGLAAAVEKGRKLGRPASLQRRASEVHALKSQGKGIRAIAKELGMAASSVHSVLKLA